MRLESITIRNLGPFRHFAVDLAELGDAKLVAITGPNGAGKSTLLELGLPGACYRTTPTRGSLLELATARDALLEARVVNGRAWTIRHLVDPISKKSEAVVLDESGAPMLADSKVRSFDDWAARHLPAPEVLLASVFSAQGAGGFLSAKPGERKATLLRILGVERLERMAEAAREHARDARQALEVATARHADELARGGQVVEAEAAVEQARQRAAELDQALGLSRAALASARDAAEQARAARGARDQLEAQLKDLQRRIDEQRGKFEDLERRITNNRGVLAEADAIRSAVARTAALRESIAALDRTAAEKQAAAQAVEREEAALQRQADDAERAKLAAEGRAARATERLRDTDLVQRAAAEVPGLRVAVDDAQTAVADVAQELELLRGQRVAGAEERITDLREALTEISNDAVTSDDPRVLGLLADQALDADDAAVTRAAELPGRVADAEERSRAAQDRLAVAQRRLTDAERLAARAADLDAARADLSAAQREAKEAHQRQLAAIREALALEPREAELWAAAQEAQAQAREARAELAEFEPIAAKADPLSRAEARIAELEPQLAAARAELIRLRDQYRELEPAPGDAVPPEPDVAGRERQVDGDEAAARRAHAELATAEQRLEQARQSAARVAELQVEIDRLGAELADWNRLADDFGRNGLQALEIDAAGPELTALTNDLLHTCHGPRFTVRVDTQRLSADGKRQIEGCDVVVLDTQGGREAQGETFSGGERVIIGEALSLALSMLACRRAGVVGPTLVRDESGAALDPVNGRVYLAMLRRAAELVGASRVLFVTHSPELQELADARIDVGGPS